MSLVINLPPDLERELRDEASREGCAAEELGRLLIQQGLAAARAIQPERIEAALALIDEWLGTERTDDGDRDWEQLKEGLEANRKASGERSLFGA
jgi:hypothetical protein